MVNLMFYCLIFFLSPVIEENSTLKFNRVTPEVEVVRLVSPAVVNIQTDREVEIGYYNLFGDWFPQDRTNRPLSQGSGVVIDADGYILTNEHVIRNADNIQVFFKPELNGKIYPAKLINADKESDLALLKITGEAPFPTVKIGRSDDLMIGERVLAIGNPFGEYGTVTSGIVSAVNRAVPIEGRTVEGLVQTDASINPGNSGGPLLNINGELIGINNAIHSLAEGIGFAIPADKVTEVLYNKLLYPDDPSVIFLGIKLGNANQPTITEVAKNSPSAQAGLAVHDRIVAINGKKVVSIFQFWKELQKSNTSSKIEVTVERNGDQQKFAVDVVNLINQLTAQKLGALVRMGGRGRVEIEQIFSDGKASRLGIQEGDIIDSFSFTYRNRLTGREHVERIEIHNTRDLLQLLKIAEPGTVLGIRILRDAQFYTGEIEIP